MNDRQVNVLFLCTGNTARSILAESILRHRGRGRFNAFSAGSHPKGEVHPVARAVLGSSRLPTEGLRSKSWDEFAAAGAPVMDVVITVCDAAAGEACPLWPGQPVIAHWSVPDPAAVAGGDPDRLAAFHAAFRRLDRRIAQLVSLPMDLDRPALQDRLRAIGADGS